MPLYDRHCTVCDELFEVQCKIAEKENPHICPYCGSTEGEWYVGAAAVSTNPSRFSTHKKDSGFNEVIQKIQSKYPKTPLSER